MTPEQLQAARAEKWRQKANPLLTIEEAETWIESTGIGLFLPRKAQLQAPAPSFVEAVLGETSETPTPSAVQNAFELALRLFGTEKAVPLNLLGTVSEQPDFLVSIEALPYVFALRGDRDWKRGPREKSSPLVIETWKLLKREGALTVSDLQELLGREITGAAVLRAVGELWTALRVLPVYAPGEATTWELFESGHQKAMQIGGGMAQATALSALISLYLDSVIAATSDEIEIFLSPLAPRSRIREVVRGLTATRQLLTIPLGAQSLFHIAGGLPEFPVIEPVTEVPPGDAAEAEARSQLRERRPFTPRGGEDRPGRERPPFGERPAARYGRKASPGFTRGGTSGPRKEWKPRDEQGGFRPRREQGRGGFDKPYRSRTTGESSREVPERKEWKPREGAKPFEKREWKPRREGSQEGRREGRERFGKPFRNRAAGESSREVPGRKEWKPREGAKPFEKREWKPRREGAQEGRREFRRGGESKGRFNRPSSSRDDDKRTGDQRRGDRRMGDQRPGDQRPYKKFPRPEGVQERPRKEWKPRPEEGERREFRPRRTDESFERREFKARPSSGRGFKPRGEGSGERGRQESSRGGRFGGKRSFGNREGFDRKKPPQRESGAEGGETERPRRSFSKPGFKGAKFGSSRTGSKKPSFGGKRPFENREGFDRKNPPQRERGAEGGETERPRKSFSRPSFKGGKFGSSRTGSKKPSFGGKRPFENREGFESKNPPQGERRAEGGDAARPRKNFSKPGFKGGKFASAKTGGKRPSFGGKRAARPGKPSFGKRPNNRKGKKSEE